MRFEPSESGVLGAEPRCRLGGSLKPSKQVLGVVLRQILMNLGGRLQALRSWRAQDGYEAFKSAEEFLGLAYSPPMLLSLMFTSSTEPREVCDRKDTPERCRLWIEEHESQEMNFFL